MEEQKQMSLPSWFCWSRFGTEAGQLINDILDRKEQERIANRGMFFWGIGNPLGPSMKELLRRTEDPEVLFSPIKSAPRAEDVAPPEVVAWTSAETLSGEFYSMPDSSLVTSGRNPLVPKETHYALVCFSDVPLVVSRTQIKIGMAELSNLLTGRPVAASQTTAIVERRPINLLDTSMYDVPIRGRLVYPYFLTLRDPLLLARADRLINRTEIIRQAWERRKLSHSPRPMRFSFP